MSACQICGTSKEQEVTAALQLQPKAIPLRVIANKTGFSVTAVWTHKVRCLALSTRSVSLEQTSRTGIDSIVRDLRGIKKKGHALWRFGKDKQNWQAMSAGLRCMTDVSKALLIAAPRQTERVREEGNLTLDKIAEALSGLPNVDEVIEQLRSKENARNDYGIEREDSAREIEGAAAEFSAERPAEDRE